MSSGRVSEEIRARVRAQSGDRCGYCLAPQRHVFAPLEIEHIVPRARGGKNNEENLWLSCRLCNSFKGTNTQGVDPVTGATVPLFNPRQQPWGEHFAWSEGGLLAVGLSASGRATVVALQLNNAIAVMVRREWIAAGWHPPRPGA